MVAAITPKQSALMENLLTWYTAIFARLGSDLLLLQKKQQLHYF